MKRKKFNNILDIPRTTEFGVLIMAGDQEKARRLYDSELRQREVELFKHYGIERPADLDLQTRELICKMAIDLGIHGFTISGSIQKPGRPSRWEGTDGFKLWAQVELEKENHPEKSLRNIIGFVRNKYYKDIEVDSLYARYYEVIENEFMVQMYISMANNLTVKAGCKRDDFLQEIANHTKTPK